MHARWLIDSGSSTTSSGIPETTEVQRQEYPLPPEIGYGWCERIPIGEDFSLFRGVHRFHREVSGRLTPLAEFKAEFPEPMLIIQTVEGGMICHRENYPSAELIYQPGFDFFRHADRLEFTPLVDSSTDSEMTAVVMSDSTLTKLMGEEIAENMLQRLGLAPPPVVKVLPMPLHISSALRDSISPTQTGALKILFAQSKVLEYLCTLASHVCANPIPRPQTDRKRDAVRDLHDQLLQLNGKLPSLEELTLRYGISARWLNEAFAKEFGKPIYSFIAEHRLNQAHAALVEGNLPIKKLSERLGYSHVNHFTTAFKKKFGYPPGSLRRKSAEV